MSKKHVKYGIGEVTAHTSQAGAAADIMTEADTKNTSSAV